MTRRISVTAFRFALAVAAAAGLPREAAAQTPVEQSEEARFQLDVHVPDAALAPMIPPGFTLNVATQGAAKDANVRVVFIDRVTINAPDGKPIGKTDRTVRLHDHAGEGSDRRECAAVIGGLTEDPMDFWAIRRLPRSHDPYDAATTSTLGAPDLDSQGLAGAGGG